MNKKSVRRKANLGDMLYSKLKNCKKTKWISMSRRVKILIASGVITLTVFSLGVSRLSVNGHYLVDDLLVERIETIKLFNHLEIGRIYRIKAIDNLPHFNNEKEAISYVKRIPYDVWEDNAQRVLETNKGNCLGKARLLYFIAEKYNYDFKFFKSENHIRLEYGGDIIELT